MKKCRDDFAFSCCPLVFLWLKGTWNVCSQKTVQNLMRCLNLGSYWQILGPAFGRTDFSRILIFEPPDFLAGFLAGVLNFLLIFVGESAQKNPPGKPPGKSSQVYTTKILQHISAVWPVQNFWLVWHYVSLHFASVTISGWRNRGVEFKGGSLHEGFGGFDGFGGSG